MNPIRIQQDTLSDSMEMYLVTILRLRESREPVPLSRLAESLGVTSVSSNEMCRKLENEGFLKYQPYKGVQLTAAGENLAKHTLRRHRLWEVFLVDKLGFGYEFAHHAACQLEHATEDAVINRLEHFLDHPLVNPIGYPIPKLSSNDEISEMIQLKDLDVGHSGVISRLAVTEEASNYFSSLGFIPGVNLVVLAADSRKLLLNVNGKEVTIARDLAKSIYIYG